MIFDWPLDLDIDALLDGLRGEPIESEDDHAGSKRALLDYGENISSIEPRFLVDARKSEDDRTLCLLQHLRFAQASRMLHMLDLFVCEGILEDASHEGDGLSGEAGADALLLTRAKSGGSWIRFDGTVLEVSVPTTPGAAALQLKGLVESAASSPENARWLAQVLEPLSSFQVTADEMRLRFEPAKDGWIRFAFSDEERSYHPDVAEQLARQGLVVTDDLEAEIQRVKSKP